MRKIRFVKAASVGVCATIAVLVATSVQAREDAILAIAYGNGVHAYHAGDYQRSYEELSTTIEGGTQDPRAFYFRGLAALRLGRLDEAEADFALGADAEAAGRGNWAVGRSLERIQGEPRLQLERHRVRARMAALQKQRESIVRHYTRIEEASPDVQRSLRPETLPRMPTPVDGAAEAPAAETVKVPAAPMPEGDDEPAEKPETPAPKPEPKPAKADDPFGDDPF